MTDAQGAPRRGAVRLFLLCHAATRANRQAAFSDEGDQLLPNATAKVAALANSLPGCDRVLCSPAAAARQTAATLGHPATDEPALRDCDFGRWRGRLLHEVAEHEPAALEAWLTDPAAAPHGGESIVDLVTRIGAWMDHGERPGPTTLAVTHAAIARAAILHVLGAPATAFWHVAAAPLSLVAFSYDGRRWCLRFGAVKSES